MPVETSFDTTQHRIGLAFRYHAGSNGCRTGAHHGPGGLFGDAAAAGERMIGFPVVTVTRIILWVDKFEVATDDELTAQCIKTHFDNFGTTNQRYFCQLLGQHRLHCAQDECVFSLSVDEVCIASAGDIDLRLHEQAGSRIE